MIQHYINSETQHNDFILVHIILQNDYCKSRVNTGHHTELTIFSCDKNSLKIYSLSNFQIFNTILSTIESIMNITSPCLNVLYIFQLNVCTFCIPSPIFPNPLFLATTVFFSVSTSLFFLTFPIKVRSYSLCPCLTYFTECNVLKVHPCCCTWQNFILFYE